ncbi:MAG: hypothetical protein NTV31_05160 [Bacteroidia bacterium]|nr:hypothetical protein [Bacteroidia bacterium]
MKKNWNSGFGGFLTILLIVAPTVLNGQSEKAVVKKYLKELPVVQISNAPQKYRMTAIYTNMDLYGKFTGKIKVSGDYTRGLENGNVLWNNVSISNSSNADEPFKDGIKQDYMENFRYVPSAKMVEDKDAFKNFPTSLDNIYSRNLVWDMMSFEIFAWNYYDSLQLNKTYITPDINGQFEMSDIGTYSHKKIMLTWTGISVVNGELCAIVEFDAIDNKIEMSMDQIKTRGTEQYWGTVMISLNTKNIEHAVMYSGTIQEVEVKGMKDKFLIKTIRELEINRIQ